MPSINLSWTEKEEYIKNKTDRIFFCLFYCFKLDLFKKPCLLHSNYLLRNTWVTPQSGPFVEDWSYWKSIKLIFFRKVWSGKQSVIHWLQSTISKIQNKKLWQTIYHIKRATLLCLRQCKFVVRHHQCYNSKSMKTCFAMALALIHNRIVLFVALCFANDGPFLRNEWLKTSHKWLNSFAIITLRQIHF